MIDALIAKMQRYIAPNYEELKSSRDKKVCYHNHDLP